MRDPDTAHPWGIATFDVDPGHGPGGQTTITMTFYHMPPATTANPFPAPVVFDTFTMSKPREEGATSGQPGGRRVLVPG